MASKEAANGEEKDEQSARQMADAALMNRIGDGWWDCDYGTVQRDFPQLSEAQLECYMEQFIQEKKWGAVSEILTRSAVKPERRWTDRLLSCFEKLVAQDKWQLVGHILQTFAVDDSESSRRLMESCFEGLVTRDDSAFSDSPLSHLPLSDSPLSHLPLSDSLLRLAVEGVLPNFSTDLLNIVLAIFVRRDKWQFASKVLETGVSETARRHAVEEASKRADESEFKAYILPYFSQTMLNLVLTNLVSRDMWWSVEKVLQSSNPVRTLALDSDDSDEYDDYDDYNDYDYFGDFSYHDGDKPTACVVQTNNLSVSYLEIVTCLIPCIPQDLLEPVLTILVEQGKFKFVRSILSRGVSESMCTWACEEAVERLDEMTKCEKLLGHFSNDQLERLLTRLVRKGLWPAVKVVLERGTVTKAACNWAVREASEKAEDSSFCRYILPYCTAEHQDRVLTTLVRQGLWKSVRKLLEIDVSDSQRWWAVQQASARLPVRYFASLFLTFCSENQLMAVFPKLVKAGLWLDVENIFAKDISGSNRKWAVEEASKIASDQDFFIHILPFCSEEEMDTVLVHRKATVILIPYLWYPKKMAQRAFVAFVLYNIGTGNNPLQLNCGFSVGNTVQYSVLQMAVSNNNCPQRMVADCIRLGLSTHQPQLTDHRNNVREMNDTRFWYKWFPSCTMFSAERDIPSICESPFLTALLLGLPLVSTMLYESGSCSYAELFALYTFFLEEFETLLETVKQENDRQSMLYNVGSENKPLDAFNSKLEAFLPYLKDMATTPRSLMSTCRLVISHSLNIRGNRHRHVQQLPLNDKMRNYVMFSDLTHPQYSPYD